MGRSQFRGVLVDIGVVWCSAVVYFLVVCIYITKYSPYSYECRKFLLYDNFFVVQWASPLLYKEPKVRIFQSIIGEIFICNRSALVQMKGIGHGAIRRRRY